MTHPFPPRRSSDLLEAYLNQVYLGQRGSQEIRGAAAGAEFWFGRELGDLSTEQIAMLIGLVKGPSAYDPRRHPENALERRNFVLAKMHESQPQRSEEHTSELQSLMRISYAVFCLQKQKTPLETQIYI